MKKSTGTDYLTTAATSGTTGFVRTRLSATALAFITRVEFLDLNLLVRAKSRLLEFDFQVVAQIRSAPPVFRARATPAEKCLENSATKAGSAEHFAENFEWIMERTAAKTHAARRECCVTKAIVGRAFVGIHQDIVRFA